MKTRSYSILILYTLLSAVTTIGVSLMLNFVLTTKIQDQLILAHSDFYNSFINAIPNNYSEVLTELLLNNQIDEHGHAIPEEADHESSSHEEGHHDSNLDSWSHFQTDVLQTPSIVQFKIYDAEKNELWSVSRDSEDQEHFENHSMIESAPLEEVSYHIAETFPSYVIHYYFPIIINGELYGIVEITDHDMHLNKIVLSTQRIIRRSLALGGMTLYLVLFLLFYQSYRNQNRSYSRLNRSQSLTIHSMSRLAELRDSNTGAHILRTSQYCKILAQALRKDNRYRKYITSNYIEDIVRSAPLHDIGKVGVPDQILNKPGKLTSEEFEYIKKHPVYGATVLKEAVSSLDFQSFFEIGYQIVLYHHENWDGSGYPSGLKGEEIPLSARIMAIADVYDALTTDRPYKDAYSHKEAIQIMKEDAGRKFDPELVSKFLLVADEFEAARNIE